MYTRIYVCVCVCDIYVHIYVCNMYMSRCWKTQLSHSRHITSSNRHTGMCCICYLCMYMYVCVYVYSLVYSVCAYVSCSMYVYVYVYDMYMYVYVYVFRICKRSSRNGSKALLFSNNPGNHVCVYVHVYVYVYVDSYSTAV